jgi:fructokinase
MPQIVCFGEMLWDLLPTGAMPGGAPMNVAIHLMYNGVNPVVISRVGTDEYGSRLLDFLKEKGLSTRFVQVDERHRTGIVHANVTNKTEVTYDIVQPVAWDFIEYSDEAHEIVALSEVFVYGSLAARHETSRNTLLELLPMAKQKVFDVNLRPPHYSPEGVEELLREATIVKLNHSELNELSNWYGSGQSGEREKMQFLKERYNLELVILTRGENGAAVLHGNEYTEHPGVAVQVEDTIGSGDSFLATFLSNYLRQQPLAEALKKACLVGAFVATRKGATPPYSPDDVEGLLK